MWSLPIGQRCIDAGLIVFDNSKNRFLKSFYSTSQMKLFANQDSCRVTTKSLRKNHKINDSIMNKFNYD